MQSRRKFVLRHVIIAVFWIRFVDNFCLDKELNKGCLPQRVLRRKVYRFSFHKLIRPLHNFRVLFPVPFLSRFFCSYFVSTKLNHLKLLIFDCTKMEFQMFNPVFKHLLVWEFRGCIPFFSFSKLFWLYLQNIPWICLFLFMSTLVSATAFSHLGYCSRLLTGFLTSSLSSLLVP